MVVCTVARSVKPRIRLPDRNMYVTHRLGRSRRVRVDCACLYILKRLAWSASGSRDWACWGYGVAARAMWPGLVSVLLDRSERALAVAPFFGPFVCPLQV